MNFKEVVLPNYGGINLKADVDEREEDILAAIKYWDHGDAFLVIVGKEGPTIYGWWLNRAPYPDYDELINDQVFPWQRSYFVRLPKLNGKFDKNSTVANELYFAKEDLEPEKRYDFFSDSFKVISVSRPTGNPQYDFGVYCEKVKNAFDSGVIYHKSEYYLQENKRFLYENDLLTNENLEKLENLREWYRIDAIDGIAGKQTMDEDDSIHGDSIEWIYYNGKQITKKYNKHGIKVKSTPDDEWGVGGFRLNLAQFYKNKEVKPV